MKLEITKVMPIWRHPSDHGMFIQWVVDGPPLNKDIVFNIERCGSPEGPFEPVIEGIRTYYFFDKLRFTPIPGPGEVRENLNYLSLNRTVFYRITAVAGSDTSVDTADTVNVVPKRLQLLKRKMLRDLSIGFKFNAVPVVILKRKHWGLRCKSCFDQLTKKVTNSKCMACFGTGFEGGYYDPVRIAGRLLAPNSDTNLTPQGKSDTTTVRFICADYPEVEPDDLIAEIEQNRRYIVMQQSDTTLRRETVHQSMVISELARDSVEYRIPINFDIAPVMY